MSCCGGGGFPSGRLGNKSGCLSSSCPPPTTMCCGKSGSVCIRLPNCSCCLPMCCPPQAPQCPTLCSDPPTCSSNGNGGCPPPCGDSCGGVAPCCPQPSPCSPKIILTKECPKKKCCPRPNREQECPDRISWPDPPRIDTCCSTSCPPRRVDICYMKVCPSPARCCPPNFPCAAKTSMGACCNGRKGY